MRRLLLWRTVGAPQLRSSGALKGGELPCVYGLRVVYRRGDALGSPGVIWVLGNSAVM